MICKTCYYYLKTITERKDIMQLGILKAAVIHMYLKTVILLFWLLCQKDKNVVSNKTWMCLSSTKAVNLSG